MRSCNIEAHRLTWSVGRDGRGYCGACVSLASRKNTREYSVPNHMVGAALDVMCDLETAMPWERKSLQQEAASLMQAGRVKMHQKRKGAVK